MSPTRLSLLLAALALLGAVSPVAAGGLGSPEPAAAETPTDRATAENATNVSVTPGAQLSTVLTATEISTRGEIETTRFEVELERGDEAERAAAIAEHAETLAERAAAIREAYEEATAAYEAGELTTQEYARRLAALNARAEQLLAEVETLRSHARNVSSLELHAAGLNRSSVRDAVDALDPLSGVGPTALLERFLGEASGEIELRSADGLRVEVEGDGGERSLEVTRPRDDDLSLTVTQYSALRTARSTLPPGNWTLETASVHPDSGYYEFEFERRAANESGEAEVRVDGSSGEVFRLEVEIEPRDDDRDGDDGERPDDNEADDHDDDREITLLVVDGQPAPNGTITVRAMVDGEPAATVPVSVNGHAVTETDARGEATLRLPLANEVEVVAGEGELEFEFDEAADEERTLFGQLDANASLHDGRVTVDVAFDGSPVEGITVYANDERAGETGADGKVTFAFDASASDELELELVKGAFEAEFEYEVQRGELVLTDSPHEGDTEDDEREEDGDGEEDGRVDEERDDETDEGEEDGEEDD